MTSSASSRPSRAPGGRRSSPSALRLALAPSSPCPHCGRTSKTVQGVCADCWGSKGGRQFWVRKQGLRTSALEDLLGFDPLHPLPLAVVAVAIPALLALLLWILA